MNASSSEAQISEFLSEYSPEMEAKLREARDLLRSCFERGYELVFNNYNALVFGISPTERASESFISVAGYPRWVTLFFLNGASLNDPDMLLDGDGARVRSIRLSSPADIDKPQVQALVTQATALCGGALSSAPMLSTIVKSSATKRRSRRPSSATELPRSAHRKIKARRDA